MHSMTERSYQGLETLSSTPDAQMPSQDASLSIYHETHSLTSFTVQEKAKKKKSADKRGWRRPTVQNEESQALPGFAASRLWGLVQN